MNICNMVVKTRKHKTCSKILIRGDTTLEYSNINEIYTFLIINHVRIESLFIEN